MTDDVAPTDVASGPIPGEGRADRWSSRPAESINADTTTDDRKGPGATAYPSSNSSTASSATP